MSPKSDLEDFEGNHWQPANSRTFSIYEFQGQSKSTFCFQIRVNSSFEVDDIEY